MVYKRLFIFTVILFIFILSACPSKPQKPKLSELDEDAFVQYLMNQGVTLPERYEISEIQNIVAELETNPEKTAPIVGWTDLSDLYEGLRAAIKEYSKSNK